jgi:transcriptional regulator with XRE-family HTH domain
MSAISPIRLIEARQRTGLSIYVFAQLIGVDDRTLELWELSRGPAHTTPHLARLANALIDAIGHAQRPRVLGDAVMRVYQSEGPIAALYLILHAKYWPLAPVRRRGRPTGASPTRSLL